MSIWTGELSVGNRAIDTEHKRLHDMINEAIGLAATKGTAAMIETLDALEARMLAYFATEERIARAVDFDFSQHRIAHQRLLNGVRQIKTEVATGNCACHENKDYAHCLMNSLIRHIKEDSRSLQVILNNHFYDFNP